MSKECIFCNKPVRWMRFKGGSALVCDAEPVGYVPDSGDDVVFAPGVGLVKGRVFGTPAKGFPVGYKAHYTSCPLTRRAMDRSIRDKSSRDTAAARAVASAASAAAAAAAVRAEGNARVGAREVAGGGQLFEGEQLSLFPPDTARIGDALWA